MNLFNRLPGFTPSHPGLEHRIWQRLPAVLLWGTVLPLACAVLMHALGPGAPTVAEVDRVALLWEFAMFGLVGLHWTLVFTVGLGCFIVRVMKGPAYVADGYHLPPATQDRERF